ncbi:preprotein translocase subunit SecA [Catenulispora yoronensis]|uniref:Protein translocase subunit SecA n=1 Tax=Catenulispora yoronensis TaxID=450799 RepID=A0ABN2UVN1_9ACTN
MSRFRLFGSGKTPPVLERCRAWARIVAQAEDEVRALPDDGLRQAVDRLRQRHQDGEDLDSLLPEMFALVREAAARTLGERPHDEQVIGGAALHLGSVIEMKTGEGKTLTATLPACLHALAGNGVHVLTANDYLVARDAAWMGPVYRMLGFTCVQITDETGPDARREAYRADIVYGTPRELAYDYLRHHLGDRDRDTIHRPYFSAIVDEADLLMLDEATTAPHISVDGDGPSDHRQLAGIADRLRPGEHYAVDKARGTVLPTEQGMAAVEDWLGAEIYNGADVDMARRLDLALQAKELYVRDRDYVVVDGAIRMIDGPTQRALTDRVLGGGLDQALDAKEGLETRPERVVMATISGFAFLGLYRRLAGMTGVVEGEVEAYRDLYGMECVRIAPHRPVRRVDHAPVLYATDKALLRAVVKTVEQQRGTGRPVLVGTVSDEVADKISRALAAQGIDHEMLTARNHDLEAAIIARAGDPGSVTVLTRMAGRGVDIRLAEPEGPGLYVLGVGPLSSRRMELHLRGRAGRGGDPGESAFFFSGEDKNIHLPKFTARMVELADTEEPLDSRGVAWSLHGRLNALSDWQAQQLAQNLRYAAVQESHRSVFYAKRDALLAHGVTMAEADELIDQALRAVVRAAPTGAAHVGGLTQELATIYAITIGREEIAAGLAGGASSKARTDLADAVVRDARAVSVRRAADLGADIADELRYRIMLSVMDRQWREHLRSLEDAASGVSLRTAAGGDPFAMYQKAATELDAKLWREIAEQFIGYWFNLVVEMPS